MEKIWYNNQNKSTNYLLKLTHGRLVFHDIEQITTKIKEWNKIFKILESNQ